MALLLAVLNYSKKILSIITKELKQFFRLVKQYQKTSRQDKKKLLMKILILEVLKYAIAIGCSYLGISEGLIPILKLLIELLLGG